LPCPAKGSNVSRARFVEERREIAHPAPRKVRVEKHRSPVVDCQRERNASVDRSERRRLDELGASKRDDLVANVLVERLTGVEEGVGVGFERVGVDFGG